MALTHSPVTGLREGEREKKKKGHDKFFLQRPHTTESYLFTHSADVDGIVVKMLSAIRKSVALEEAATRKGHVASGASEAIGMPFLSERSNDAIRDALIEFLETKIQITFRLLPCHTWRNEDKRGLGSTFRSGAVLRTRKTVDNRDSADNSRS